MFVAAASTPALADSDDSFVVSDWGWPQQPQPQQEHPEHLREDLRETLDSDPFDTEFSAAIISLIPCGHLLLFVRPEDYCVPRCG